MDSRLSFNQENEKMKKITADQIIRNLNARIALLQKQGHRNSQLSELLNEICRHSAGIENIDDSTLAHHRGLRHYED